MKKRQNFKFYWKLFYSTLYLSAFTFGGGFVIIPLLRQKFVEEYGWIEEQEILDLTAIAQSAPGSVAVNASILIGYQLAGFTGALITILATVLPPFVTLSIISFFYGAFKENPMVNGVLRGMSAGVAAVIADVVLKMGKPIIVDKNHWSLMIMILAFLAVFLFHLNMVMIIAGGAVLGLFNTLYHRHHHKEAGSQL